MPVEVVSTHQSNMRFAPNLESPKSKSFYINQRIRSLSRIRSKQRRETDSPTSVAGILFTADSYDGLDDAQPEASYDGYSTVENTAIFFKDDGDDREIEAVDVSRDEADDRPMPKSVEEYLKKVASHRSAVDHILGNRKLQTRDGVPTFQGFGDEQDDNSDGLHKTQIQSTNPIFVKAEKIDPVKAGLVLPKEERGQWFKTDVDNAPIPVQIFQPGIELQAKESPVLEKKKEKKKSWKKIFKSKGKEERLTEKNIEVVIMTGLQEI